MRFLIIFGALSALSYAEHSKSNHSKVRESATEGTREIYQSLCDKGGSVVASKEDGTNYEFELNKDGELKSKSDTVSAEQISEMTDLYVSNFEKLKDHPLAPRIRKFLSLNLPRPSGKPMSLEMLVVSDPERCGPCRSYEPTVNRLQKAYEFRVDIKVGVPSEMGSVPGYGGSIPYTLIRTKDTKQILLQKSGPQSEETLGRVFDKYLTGKEVSLEKAMNDYPKGKKKLMDCAALALAKKENKSKDKPEYICEGGVCRLKGIEGLSKKSGVNFDLKKQ